MQDGRCRVCKNWSDWLEMCTLIVKVCVKKIHLEVGVVWTALEDGLGIIIRGDMNAHIWELDGCENENGDGKHE